jgi:dipeptide transport system permease protein
MLRFLLSRFGRIVPTFFGITFVAFIFPRILRGDPVLLLAGERGVSPERYQQLVEQFGFDRPLVVQYFDYVWGILRGDFGEAIGTHTPVLTEFLTLFPATLELSFFAMLFAVVIGVPAGILAAVKRGSFFDQSFSPACSAGRRSIAGSTSAISFPPSPVS